MWNDDREQDHEWHQKLHEMARNDWQIYGPDQVLLQVQVGDLESGHGDGRWMDSKHQIIPWSTVLIDLLGLFNLFGLFGVGLASVLQFSKFSAFPECP